MALDFDALVLRASLLKLIRRELAASVHCSVS